MGFGKDLAHPQIGYIVLGIILYPSAPSYDNLEGKIWMPEPTGKYDKRSEGGLMIALREPYGSSPAGDPNGGSYDKR